MRYPVNCPTVVCLHTVVMIMREMPLVNLWPPGLFSISKFFYTISSFLFAVLFYHYPSLLFAFNLVTKDKGLNNPLSTLGASLYFVCVQV